VNDCASVVLRVVSDADPDEEEQAFQVSPPLFLQAVEVDYFIGDFQARIAESSQRFVAEASSDKND
jgi:hypothetical protein